MSWSGAGKGAAMGSAAGPIGAGVGAIFGAFMGNKDKDDSGALDLDSILKDVSAKRTAETQRGTDYANMSAQTLAPVLQYFKSLTGGDPNAIASATRPERARVIDQYDTARKAISEFGGRGGGANAAVASSQFNQASDLANIGANARTNAINQSAVLGKALADLGLSEDQLASGDLNTLVQAVLNKRGQNMQSASGMGEALGTLLGLYLTRNKEGGGGGGVSSSGGSSFSPTTTFGTSGEYS